MAYHQNLLALCDSVYIRMHSSATKTYDLTKLIRAVAKRHIVGDGLILMDSNTDHVYERNTKKFIVGRTRLFILGLSEWQCDEENMARFVSLTQMNKLITALSKKGKWEISCYSFVYIYIIYLLLDSDEDDVDICIEIMENLYKDISSFYAANPENQLAAFLVGCYKKIIQALRRNDRNLTADRLPAVPRKHVFDEQD